MLFIHWCIHISINNSCEIDTHKHHTVLFMSWIKSFDSAKNHLIQLKRISMFELIILLLAQSHKMAKVRLGFRCQISHGQIYCIKFPTHNPAFFKVHSYFDDWNNIEFNSFGSTQIDICFGTWKVRHLSQAWAKLAKTRRSSTRYSANWWQNYFCHWISVEYI